MYYHLSENPNLTVLTPQVPRYAIGDWEDVKTKRVCFSNAINLCLTALQNPGTYYVYTLVDDNDSKDFYRPTNKQVIDVDYTEEIWCLKEIKVKLLGKIKAVDKFHENVEVNGREVGVYYFNYQWVNEETEESYYRKVG